MSSAVPRASGSRQDHSRCADPPCKSHCPHRFSKALTFPAWRGIHRTYSPREVPLVLTSQSENLEVVWVSWPSRDDRTNVSSTRKRYAAETCGDCSGFG